MPEYISNNASDWTMYEYISTNMMIGQHIYEYISINAMIEQYMNILVST